MQSLLLVSLLLVVCSSIVVIVEVAIVLLLHTIRLSVTIKRTNFNVLCACMLDVGCNV